MKRFAFTLIELLVVIAIIAVLAVVVVLTLNPAQLLAQSRDANRVSDMATLNSAINIYLADQPGAFSLGNASSVYLSVPDLSLSGSGTSTCTGLGMPAAVGGYNYFCVSSANGRLVSSLGWIPMNFSLISAGAPFGSLPVDPTNQTSSNLFYTYEASGSNFVISSFMESIKYAKNMAATGGVDAGLYEMGSGANTLPDLGRGLVGYWPLDEGQGATTRDVSGSGNTGTVNGAAVWATGQIGNALTFVNTTTFMGSGSAMNMGTTWTMLGWVKTISGTQMPMVSDRSPLGGNTYMGMNAGKLFYYSSCVPSSLGGGVLLNDGKYHQIGFVTTPTNVTGYLDGSTGFSGAVTGCAAQNAKIDIGWDPMNGNDFFNGTIDDVRVYNRALSAGEIQQIYNAEK